MIDNPTTEPPRPVRVRTGYVTMSCLADGTVIYAGCEPVLTDEGAERSPVVEIHFNPSAVVAPGVVVLSERDAELQGYSLGYAAANARESVTKIRPEGIHPS